MKRQTKQGKSSLLSFFSSGLTFWIRSKCKSIGELKIELIGSNINELNLSEPQFHPIFEHAEKIGCSIFIHPWEMMGQNKMQKYWLPWLVGMPAETSRAICRGLFGVV